MDLGGAQGLAALVNPSFVVEGIGFRYRSECTCCCGSYPKSVSGTLTSDDALLCPVLSSLSSLQSKTGSHGRSLARAAGYRDRGREREM